jgi:hypothetical protein
LIWPFRWIDCGRDGHDWTGCDWIGVRSGLPGVGKWLKPDRVDEARRNLAQPNPA